MFKNVEIMMIRAISPVHAGTGREIGVIDMPIQREVSTGLPKIEASSFKGSLRDAFRICRDGNSNIKIDEGELFGSIDNETDKDARKKAKAGVLGVSDAKLLFYPIKSLTGIYKYITCAFLLNRFVEDIRLSHKSKPDEAKQIRDIRQGNFYYLHNAEDEYMEIILDDFLFTKLDPKLDPKSMPALEKHIATWNNNRDFLVVSDDDFMDLIALNREIITRNRIDTGTGTVEDKALFTEEYLPAESVMYSLLLQNGVEDKKGVYNEFINYLNSKNNKLEIIQVGGNSNIGKGLIQISLLKENEENGNTSH